MKYSLLFCTGILVAFLAGCGPDSPGPSPSEGDLEGIPYEPQPYTIQKPASFPPVPVPADNPMTVAGVQLGRRLFYDPILSGDSTQSCSSCHLPAGSFTDNKALSLGIDGLPGRRSAMSLLDVAYVPPAKGLFWNGRAATLEEQALLPVEDPLEMHAIWPEVVEKLKRHPDYPTRFRQAFGISDRGEITKELVAKALSQFERTLISSGTSKFDRWKRGEAEFTDEELNGYFMFAEQGGPPGIGLPDAQCFHCHGGGETLLSPQGFFNNGLDSVATLEDFTDKGLWEVTGLRSDMGKFRSPTLRNIALSAPYMHDGRLQTLEEVIDQYSDNGSGVENEDPFIRQVGIPFGALSVQNKKDLLAFLLTLTDTTVVNNPDHQNPFQ